MLVGVLEKHDRDRFEIYGYSLRETQDCLTKRIKSAVDQFREFNNLDDDRCLEIARADELDIAIDLMGYTTFNRASIFSNRLAPVQINFLDYSGTTGNKNIDYVIIFFGFEIH